MAQEDWPPLSPEIQAAQARLLQLRSERGIQPRDASPDDLTGVARTPIRQPARSEETNWLLHNAQKDLARRRAAVRSGHFSTAPDRRAAVSDRSALASTPSPVVRGPSSVVGDPPLATCASSTVIVHPTILLAILKQDLEAPGRVWLLLRAIDGEGRGWLSVEEARRRLAEKDSPLHICGWRRLRQLLKQGDGIFWQRDAQDRLWLNGAHKIAYKLDCDRLQGFPVELPIQALLGGIQAVRAAFYAAFHGGRDSKPISRETLESISGIPGRTQLEYDRVARVKRRRNIAIGERHTNENAQERAWRHGRAAFHFIDIEGRQGRAGREYVAWHLPNSYRADYQRRSRGSRKRLNRKLADLVKKGIPGNDERRVERCFFANGALAARRYNRDPEHDAYWRQENPTRAGGRLWHVIAGMEV